VPAGRFNVKYSRGGLVDVEYAAQYLQLRHGRPRPELRTPSTSEALDRLRSGGLLSAAEHGLLTRAYAFSRAVVAARRVGHGHARALLLPEEGSSELLGRARRLGYPGTAAAEALRADAGDHRDRVRAFFDARFGA